MVAGVRANEAKAINLSLTVLGMCINARASNVPVHVPYRDSKLTRLLKVCLMQTSPATLEAIGLHTCGPARLWIRMKANWF